MSGAPTLDKPVESAPPGAPAASGPGIADISEAELDALIKRIEQAMNFAMALEPSDYALLLDALGTLATVQHRLNSHDVTLHKLRKLLGIVKASEKSRDLLADRSGPGELDANNRSNRPPRRPKNPPQPPVKPTVVHHPLNTIHKGDTCPGCQRGKVYKFEPAQLLRITGDSPYSAHQHVCEQVRCGTCQEVFSAELPPELRADGEPGQMYGYSARTLMAIDKYYAGQPFYRQQSIQSLLGIKVTASTIFDQCEHVADALQPIWKQMLALAADARVFYIDDTTHRILDQKQIQKRRRGSDKLQRRTGVYTSSLLALYNDDDDGGLGTRRIVLFQTSIGHAGEWIDEVLSGRSVQLPKPIVMSDALSANKVTVTDVSAAKCNVHCRRNFVELINQYPQETHYVLETYKVLWANEHECVEHALSDQQRLQYHRQHSLPAMQSLEQWCHTQLATEPVESNSNFGQAINYFLNHYDELTLFCTIPGVPIDNNEIERQIKLIVRSRKNSYFYKTQAGAWISDIVTSMLVICQENGVNAFEYLNAIQRNQRAVKANPKQWLPWNYSADP